MADVDLPEIHPDNSDGNPPEPGSDDAPFEVQPSAVPKIAWVGAFALLAVGVVAALFAAPVVGAIALAVGIVAVAAAVLADTVLGKGGPVAAAGRATWSLWAAARALVNGRPGDAIKFLAMPAFTDWIWFAIIVAIAAVALRRQLKRRKK